MRQEAAYPSSTTLRHGGEPDSGEKVSVKESYSNSSQRVFLDELQDFKGLRYHCLRHFQHSLKDFILMFELTHRQLTYH